MILSADELSEASAIGIDAPPESEEPHVSRLSTSVQAISPRDFFTMLWMLRPALPIAAEICPSMFGTLALAIATRYGDSRVISTLGI
jgi:hypothetical protein